MLPPAFDREKAGVFAVPAALLVAGVWTATTPCGTLLARLLDGALGAAQVSTVLGVLGLVGTATGGLGDSHREDRNPSPFLYLGVFSGSGVVLYGLVVALERFTSPECVQGLAALL